MLGFCLTSPVLSNFIFHIQSSFITLIIHFHHDERNKDSCFEPLVASSVDRLRLLYHVHAFQQSITGVLGEFNNFNVGTIV